MSRAAALLSTACLLAASPARAGVTLTFDGRGGRSTLVVEGGKARLEGGGEIAIFDAEARTLLLLAADKSYTVTTEAELRAQGRQLKAELAARREVLLPEQRQQLEALGRPRKRGAAKGAGPELRPTGRMEQVAGFTCEVHEREQQGRTIEELCLVPWGSGTIAREELAALDRLAAFFEVLLTEIGPGAAEAMRASRSNLVALPGFPARTAAIRDDGRPAEEEVLTGFTRGPVPASSFAVPPGYRQVN